MRETRREVVSHIAAASVGPFSARVVGRTDGSGVSNAVTRQRDAPRAGRRRDGPGVGRGDASVVAERVVSVIEKRLAEDDLPGASVAVVDGETIALADGIGVADRKSGRPATAQTPFRVGSVSKAVTWTALMARIQHGELTPETHVNEIVAVPVPTRHGSISVANLATHRGGLEDATSQLWIRDPDEVGPLPTHLRRATVEQVRPPGVVGSYSNYGAALGGQVLAAVRGEPFTTAIEAELLGPTGMDASSFRQPLPGSLADAHATGHGAIGPTRNGEFPFVGLRPAGALSTTATDMARFLRLHTNDGVVDGQQVLDPETVAACHRRWATHDDRLAGMAFGTWEGYRGDTRFLRHNGATPTFRSEIVLLPETGLGLFVAFNSGDAGAAAGAVVDAFLDAAVGSGGWPADEPDGRPTRADDLSGTYRSIRRSETSHERLTSTLLTAPTVTVRIADDGALVTETDNETERWVETARLVFDHETERRRLAFQTDGDRIAYLTIGGRVSAFEPAEDLSAQGAAAVGAIAGLASGTLRPFAATIRRWVGGSDERPTDEPVEDRDSDEIERSDLTTDSSVESGEPIEQNETHGSAGRNDTNGSVRRDETSSAGESNGSVRRDETDDSGVGRVWWGLSVVCGALLVFPIAIGAHFAVTPLAILSNPPATFAALFSLPIGAAVGTIAVVAYTIRAGPHESWSRVDWAHYAIVVGSLTAAVWLLWEWNLFVPP